MGYLPASRSWHRGGVKSANSERNRIPSRIVPIRLRVVNGRDTLRLGRATRERGDAVLYQRARHRDKRGFRSIAATWLRVGGPLLLAALVLLVAWMLRPSALDGIAGSPVALAMIGVG